MMYTCVITTCCNMQVILELSSAVPPNTRDSRTCLKTMCAVEHISLHAADQNSAVEATSGTLPGFPGKITGTAKCDRLIVIILYVATVDTVFVWSRRQFRATSAAEDRNVNSGCSLFAFGRRVAFSLMN